MKLEPTQNLPVVVHTRLLKPLAVVAVLVCTVLSAGCGLSPRQEAAVRQFGAASTDLASISRQHFVDSRHEVIAMNRLRRQLGDEIAPLEGQLTAERVRVRVRAMNALERYGQLLLALAEHDEGPALQNASMSFIDSLRQIEGISINDGQAGAIAQSIAAVGGLWVDAQRKKATVAAVEWSHPHVIHLVNLLEESFAPDGDAWSLEYETVTTALKGAAVIARGDLVEHDLLGRALVQEAADFAELNQQTFELISPRVIRSAQALADAHRDLRNVLRADVVTVERISSFLKTMDKLAESYAILKR